MRDLNHASQSAKLGNCKAMICREFPLLYSAQLDGHADEREQMAVQKHLRECIVCRRTAAEMRTLRSELMVLELPKSLKAKTDLTIQLQSALRVEARAHEQVKRSRRDLIDVWRTRLFSQGIGALVSTAMCLVIFAGVMRPAYRTLSLAQAASEVIWEDEMANDIRFKLWVYQPPPPPVFTPSGEILDIGADLAEDDVIIVTLKVRRDGRASINEMVSPPSDPTMMNKFSNALTLKASFQPNRGVQATSAEAVVILSKVDVKASISG